MSNIREYRKNIRFYLEEQHKYNFETRISHILPQSGKGFLRAFVFSEIRKGNNYQVSEPLEIIDIDKETFEVCNYKELSAKDDDVKWIEYSPITHEKMREYLEKLFGIYDVVLDCCFCEKSQLSKADIEKINEFAELFYKAVPKEMMPFYLLYGKEFFDWIKELSV